MSTAAIKGDFGILFIRDVAGEAWKPVACLTSNSLATNVEVIDRQTKCAPGVIEKSAGAFTFNLSLEGEYIDTTTVGGDDTKKSHDRLLELQETKELINWFLDTDINASDGVKYYGQGLITDLSLDQGVAENSTFSGTIDGSGSILRVDPFI